MSDDPLRVVSVSDKKDPKRVGKRNRREEMQATLEYLWRHDKEQFNPRRNIQERVRIERSFELLKTHLPETLKKCADLGCGAGEFTLLVSDFAPVDAVDLSSLALDMLKKRQIEVIKPIQDYVPHTSLEDEAYDLICCLELIAYLPEDELRLFFSEIARLIKPEGRLICSTPLDIHSEDALQRFASLAEREFEIEKWKFSWHRLYLHLRNFFEAPSRFVKASKDKDYLARKLEKRRGLSRFWFRLNSTILPAFFWRLIQIVSRPLASALRQSRSCLLFFEKICRFLWSDSGITHAILVGKRRAIEFTPVDERPRETKHKKQLWE